MKQSILNMCNVLYVISIFLYVLWLFNPFPVLFYTAYIMCFFAYKVNEKLSSELMVGARIGNIKKMKSCLYWGASINAQDDNGNTALMILLKRNVKCDDVTMLIDQGIDVNAKNKDGDTALKIACEDEEGKVHTDIVTALLDGGADDSQNITGKYGLRI